MNVHFVWEQASTIFIVTVNIVMDSESASYKQYFTTTLGIDYFRRYITIYNVSKVVYIMFCKAQN